MQKLTASTPNGSCYSIPLRRVQSRVGQGVAGDKPNADNYIRTVAGKDRETPYFPDCSMTPLMYALGQAFTAYTKH